MRPGRRRTALAAAQAAAALALTASAAAAQTATSVALPPFSYFGSALVTHDLSPSAREAGVISQAQIQQLYRSMSDSHGLTIPQAPPRCADDAGPPGQAAAARPAPPPCVPSPSTGDVSESELDGLQAGPAR